MSIDNMTIKELRELRSLFGTERTGNDSIWEKCGI